RTQTGEASPSWQVRGADVTAGVIYRDSNVVVKRSRFRTQSGRMRSVTEWKPRTAPSSSPEIATKAQPRLLVLYHQLYFGGASDDDLLREIRSRYHGRVVSAHDLDVY